MPDRLKIALLQIEPGETLDENLQKGIQCCKMAKQMGADIALFPEMWSNGYRIYGRPEEEWKSEAISSDSSFVHAFQDAAREHQMAVGITLLEKYEGGPRNSLILLSQKRC